MPRRTEAVGKEKDWSKWARISPFGNMELVSKQLGTAAPKTST